MKKFLLIGSLLLLPMQLSLSATTADPQINGTRDDGTDTGKNRSQVMGNMVKIPFDLNILPGSGVSARSGYVAAENSDGSCTSILLTTASGWPPNASYYYEFSFNGTVLGVRYNPNFISGSGVGNDFDVEIDGRPYRVKRATILRDWLNQLITGQTFEVTTIIDSNLPEGPHVGKISLASDKSGNVNAVQLYGLVVDGNSGFNTEPAYAGYTAPPILLTTSFVQVVTGNQGAGNGRTIKSIAFWNSAGTAANVTVQVVGATALNKLIQPNDTFIWDLGYPTVPQSNAFAIKSDINNAGGAISSLTSSSTTATAVVTSTTGLSMGSIVTISGAGVTGYNGTVSVLSVTDMTHFTYTLPNGGTGLGSSSGTYSGSGIYYTATIGH